MSVDPIKPYADLAKIIAIAVAAMMFMALLFMGGRAVGKGQDAKVIAAKNVALVNAAHALEASSRILRSVDAESKRRIKAAEDAKRASDKAGIVAAAAQHTAEAKLAAYDRRELQARRKPGCAELLERDLAKECGL